MRLKGLLKILAAGLVFFTTLSCGGNKEIIDPKALLTYGKEPSEQNMEVLSKSYSAVIGKNRKSGVKTPGIYSDYAVMLAKQGRRAEANGWFNKEMEAFPSSRSYVLQLKRRLIPEYQDDNSTTITDSDSTIAEPDALTPAQRKRAEKKAAAVMGDTLSAAAEGDTIIDAGATPSEEENIGEEDMKADEQSEAAPAEDEMPESKATEDEGTKSEPLAPETETKQ